MEKAMKCLGVMLVMIFGPFAGLYAQHFSEKPNIVFIIADDLGIGDIGPYGQTIIPTPNLDKMASTGMKFNDFYAGSTVCAPSRASLMTGQHTGHTLVRGNGEYPLESGRKILPERLKEAGYTNAMFGKWGLGLANTHSSPEKVGWDHFVGHLHHVSAHYQKPDSLDCIIEGEISRMPVPKGKYANDLFVENSIEFIETQTDEQPFFLYLSLTVPHAELLVPERYFQPFLDESGKSIFPSEKAHPEGLHYGAQPYPKAAYAALVSSIDDYVGRVMSALEKIGIAENTLVIFTSDNGTHVEGGRRMEDVDYFKSSAHFRGVKRDLFDGGIKVPLMVNWPGKIKEGSTSDFRGAFWDLFPTLSHLAGIEVDRDDTDGISFLPTLLGQKQKENHSYLYWEFHEEGGKQALLQGDWKLVRLDINKTEGPKTYLYKVTDDPGEVDDLSSKHPGKVKRMNKILDQIRTPNPYFEFN
ncbi:Arylsulfatase [Indibacter alkaliphilus LW1]|uniref:Arylsulfatase n=1 Tax=Indibacter alkaliphilus (strain CCUG 57479 / KCTC 22604 / LW1) TaxID=1189612 RepID=S2DNZ4_INDAL|nr:arylsulfatase [Indibacter alkaliphilus]EOZ91528.1 Arylsulfatase [Indibacter alkaliphilus LW1]